MHHKDIRTFNWLINTLYRDYLKNGAHTLAAFTLWDQIFERLCWQFFVLKEAQNGTFGRFA